MKSKHLFGVAAALLAVLIFALSLTNFNPSSAFALASAPLQHASPIMQENDDSEIGSTDGIVVMGVVIVLIVTLPLAIRGRK